MFVLCVYEIRAQKFFLKNETRDFVRFQSFIISDLIFYNEGIPKVTSAFCLCSENTTKSITRILYNKCLKNYEGIPFLEQLSLYVKIRFPKSEKKSILYLIFIFVC